MPHLLPIVRCRPVSAISSLPPTPPALPARPASIAGLPSIPETPSPPPLPPANSASGPRISQPTPRSSFRRQSIGTSLANSTPDGATILEARDDVDSFQAAYEEPPYSEPFTCKVSDRARSRSSRSSEETVDIGLAKDSDDDLEDYPYQDIYEEIRQHQRDGKEPRDEELPDVVTSAYASGEQVGLRSRLVLQMK